MATIDVDRADGGEALGTYGEPLYLNDTVGCDEAATTTPQCGTGLWEG